MKKTTAKGAYAKSKKSQMMIRRAPVVEIKSRNHAEVEEFNGYLVDDENSLNAQNPLKWRSIPTDDAFSLIPLDSFYRISQGLRDSQCIGTSITSRWLALRTEFRFPHGENITLIDGSTNPPTPYAVPNRVIQNPCKLYLICGYVTRKWGLPITQMNAQNSLIAQDATNQNLLEYITSQIKPYFDESQDKLRFNPKTTMNVKVLKYRKIAPNLNQSIPSQVAPQHVVQNPDGSIFEEQAQGSLPAVSRSHKWTINNKRRHQGLGRS